MKPNERFNFPLAVYIAKPESVEESGLYLKDFNYLYFEDLRGNRILVCHGSEDGSFPLASRRAIEKYKPEYIYCCHPAIVRHMTGDKRVVGTHNNKVQFLTKAAPGKGVIVTIRRKF